jgi:uncharacterized protein YecT (DUF1311 family)
MMRPLLLSLSVMLFPGLALANGCENPRNSYDAVHCEQKIYQKADDDLNKTYKQLIAKLDKEGKKILKHEQLAWIRERDTECTMHSADAGEVIQTGCMTTKTTERTNFLQERYRECVTAGCMNSRLAP